MLIIVQITRNLETNVIHSLKYLILLALLEKVTETLDLEADSREYYKIDCRGNFFPIFVTIKVDRGTYEIFTSVKTPSPGAMDYDHFYTASTFTIDHPNNKDIETVYMSVRAITKTFIHLTYNFSTKSKRNTQVN
jgi:hypothetical protein